MSTQSPPLSAGRPSLRKDLRQWEIEDDSAAEAALRAFEVMGLIFSEMFLRRLAENRHLTIDESLALKGIGTLSGRVGMTRMAYLTGVDERGFARREAEQNPDYRAAGEMVREVLNWLLEWDLGDPDAPPSPRYPDAPPAQVVVALKELHAAAMYLDRRAGEAGMSGSGRKREIARSTTRERLV